MRSRMLQWWNNAAAIAPEVVAALHGAITNRPKKLASGIEAFLQATNNDSKDMVLTKHPFWQHSDVVQMLDAQTMVAVLAHITNVSERYRDALLTGQYKMYYDEEWTPEEDARIRGMRGLVWGTTEAFTQWATHAFALAEKEPNHAQALMDAIGLHLATASACGERSVWVQTMEKFLALGGVLPVEILWRGIWHHGDNNLTDVVVDGTILSQRVFDAANDHIAINCAKRREQAHRLLTIHPRLTGWDIAEYLDNPKDISKLAERMRDGARLKAWHGVALTQEDMRTDPLAYSLYAHKHAPNCIAEAVPLPPVWHMALSLCTSGIEFQNVLATVKKADMNPQAAPEALALPDLGP